MSTIAQSLAHADEVEAQYDSAKSANIGATAILCRWRRHATESLGADSDIVKNYDAELLVLREQLDRINDHDVGAMQEAMILSKEIKAKYGNKKEREITAEDHLKAHNPNGPG